METQLNNSNLPSGQIWLAHQQEILRHVWSFQITPWERLLAVADGSLLHPVYFQEIDSSLARGRWGAPFHNTKIFC